MTKIADPHSLALHEALMIEGSWDQYTDQELASYCSKGSNPARLRDQLASGELVLLTESPAVPVFKLASGSLAPAGSASIAIAENAVSAFETRFGSRSFPSRAAGYSRTDSLPPSPKLDYTPEPPVVDWPPEPLPPPVVISENFALPPLGPKVFAKSCTRPSGDTSSNEGQEKASNFGTLAVFAPATIASPGAKGLRPLSLLSGSAMRLTNGWAMAARLGASILGTAASTALLALWPSKLGDGTLYTEDELLEMAEAAIRVRFHLHVDATGSLRIAGYHVNDSTGYGDRVPVAHAQRVGENFEVVVDDGFTLVWYPDESGHRPVVSTEYPADSGIDPYSILVTPIQEDGQEHSPPGYQRPFEDQVELIVSFPADSGVEPLYLVFQKRAGGDEEAVPDNTLRFTAEQADNLKRSARDEFERLNVAKQAGQLTNAELGPALSVAQDLRTGQMSQVWRNNSTGDAPTNLSDALARRWVEAPDEVLAFERSNGMASHAEIYAVDELLKIRPDASINDFAVFTMETRIQKYRGEFKPACTQCNWLLEGVQYVK